MQRILGVWQCFPGRSLIWIGPNHIAVVTAVMSEVAVMATSEDRLIRSKAPPKRTLFCRQGLGWNERVSSAFSYLSADSDASYPAEDGGKGEEHDYNLASVSELQPAAGIRRS